MEWTWRQQLFMLLQSSGVGFLLGILYDLVVTAGRVRRFTRPAVFVVDALFGIVSALVTFFFSLAIMDGRLHPLLFAGCGVGFAAQHLSVSRLLCRVLYRVGVLICKLISRLKWLLKWPFIRLFVLIKRIFEASGGKSFQNGEKIAKKFLFFQKKS